MEARYEIPLAAGRVSERESTIRIVVMALVNTNLVHMGRWTCSGFTIDAALDCQQPTAEVRGQGPRLTHQVAPCLGRLSRGAW
jgi:hypothetical protein